MVPTRDHLEPNGPTSEPINLLSENQGIRAEVLEPVLIHVPGVGSMGFGGADPMEEVQQSSMIRTSQSRRRLL